MFEGQKLVTRYLNESVLPDIQMILWGLVEEIRGKIKHDYLQVFDLSIENVQGIDVQVVKHTQERPRYKKIHRYLVVEPVKARIFIIDSEEYCTMLFAEEY